MFCFLALCPFKGCGLELGFFLFNKCTAPRPSSSFDSSKLLSQVSSTKWECFFRSGETLHAHDVEGFPLLHSIDVHKLLGGQPWMGPCVNSLSLKLALELSRKVRSAAYPLFSSIFSSRWRSHVPGFHDGQLTEIDGISFESYLRLRPAAIALPILLEIDSDCKWFANPETRVSLR